VDKLSKAIRPSLGSRRAKTVPPVFDSCAVRPSRGRHCRDTNQRRFEELQLTLALAKGIATFERSKVDVEAGVFPEQFGVWNQRSCLDAVASARQLREFIQIQMADAGREVPL